MGPRAEIIELREQLLDELNHRLKNNLQMLYGFLELALRKTNNSEAREVLSDTSRHIGAMGTAQQVFYSVRDSTDVSGQRFVEAVCTNARAFFSKEVSIDFEATAGFLPKETAVPLALALNELLTNAAKHDLRGGRQHLDGLRRGAVSTIEQLGRGPDPRRCRFALVLHDGRQRRDGVLGVFPS
jgi:two-component sensor histidine kinase